MKLLLLALTSLSLALAAPACGGKKDGGGGEGGGAAEGGGGEGGEASGGLTLEAQKFEFEAQRNADQRKLKMVVDAEVPKGWAPDPQAKPGPNMKTLLPPAKKGQSMFSRSNMTLSATCHGQCRQDKFAEQIKGIAEQQMKFAMGGDKKKLIKDEQIREGVTGFVIESPNGDKTAYTMGVSHWQPGWPKIIFCNAFITGDEADAWQQVYKACGDLKVTVDDPMMPADVMKKEQDNLAKCPKASTLTYTANPMRDGQPTTFGDVKVVKAFSSRPGYVSLYLANYDMKSARLRDAPLEGEQRVISLIFNNKGGEILSGKYTAKYDQDARVAPALSIAGGTKLQWTAASTEGDVEIIARTDDKICGKVNLSGGNRGTLSGEFVADIELGSPK